MLSTLNVLQTEEDTGARRTPSAPPRRHPNLERLICAAMSNKRVAQQLLVAPALLAESGYAAELLPNESALLESIENAHDIYDFAAQLYRRIREA